MQQMLGHCVAPVNMNEHVVVSSAQTFEQTASSGTFEQEDRTYSVVWCSIVRARPPCTYQ